MLNEKQKDIRWAVITGSTSGIGLGLAKILVNKGFGVILTGSTKEKCEKAKVHVIDSATKIDGEQDIENRVKAFAADLRDESFGSIDLFIEFVASVTDKIDYLVLNAGMLYTEQVNLTTKQFDLLFQVNCLSQFYITIKLIDQIEASESKKIVFTGSSMMFGGSKEALLKLSKLNNKPFNSANPSDKMKAYCNSKLALAVFASKLHEELQKSKSEISVSNFIPGMVLSSLKQTNDNRENIVKTSEASMHKFSSDQAAGFLAEVLVERNIKEMVSFGSYKFPWLLSVNNTSNDGVLLSQVRGSLFWINENFQKLTAKTKNKRTHSSSLYKWGVPSVVKDKETIEQLWKLWMNIIS